MAVNLSPIGGVAGQFFDNNGVILSGGKIYTYSAGTSTNAATYTSSSGGTAHTNPIILDAAGRVPSGEIWLSDGVSYKFVVKTAQDVLIGTYDNITGINSNFVAYTSEQEIQTATAGQTVFTLATMQYQPNTNNLSVFVDGVNQYGPGAQYAFVETDATTVTFVDGLHVGASVKFTTASPVASAVTTADNVSYDPPFAGSTITNVQDKLAQTVSVMDFGAIGDGVTDDYQAFQDAIDSLPVSGGTISIPATATNEWVISQTLNVRKKLHLIGQIAKGTGTKGTTLVFPADTSGIVFNSYNTSLYQTVAADPLLPGAYGSILENVALYGDKAGSSTSADGVVVRCTMECRGVAVRNFYRYGFRIYADLGTGGSTEGDANQWALYRCDAIANGSHGVYVNGDDANTGTAIKVFSQLNGGYGFYENSLIGNTYIGCDTVGNTSGSMWADRASAANTVIGLWEDDSSSHSQFGGVNTIIGGNGGNPTSTSSAFSMWQGIAKQAPYKYINNRGSEQVAGQLGTSYSDTSMTVQSFGATSEGSDTAWKFQFDATEKAWFLQYADSAAFTPIAYLNSSASLYTLKGFTGPVFRNGYAVRKSGNINTSKVRMLDSAAPTTGTWAVGDIVYNDTPASGGYIGWVCTVAGTPGTWKTFGLIS